MPWVQTPVSQKKKKKSLTGTWKHKSYTYFWGVMGCFSREHPMSECLQNLTTIHIVWCLNQVQHFCFLKHLWFLYGEQLSKSCSLLLLSIVTLLYNGTPNFLLLYHRNLVLIDWPSSTLSSPLIFFSTVLMMQMMGFRSGYSKIWHIGILNILSSRNLRKQQEWEVSLTFSCLSLK
jgi:hypothetical protein